MTVLSDSSYPDVVEIIQDIRSQFNLSVSIHDKLRPFLKDARHTNVALVLSNISLEDRHKIHREISLTQKEGMPLLIELFRGNRDLRFPQGWRVLPLPLAKKDVYHLLHFVLRSAAQLIINSEKHHQTELKLRRVAHEKDQLKNLYKAAKIIYAKLNIEERLNRISKILARLLKSKVVKIYLLDSVSQTLIRHPVNFEQGALDTIPMGKKQWGKVAKTGKLLFIPNKILCAPLVFGDDIIGVLSVEEKNKGGLFTHIDEGILLDLASHIATAIHHSQLFSMAEQMAMHDSLTGLYNRRYFHEFLQNALSKAKSQKYALCAMMLDIDYFKSINDTYGHLVGDQVLKRVAEILKSSVRRIDLVARYGGEEMVLVLIGISQHDAQDVAEKIRSKVAGMQLFVTKTTNVGSDTEYNLLESDAFFDPKSIEQIKVTVSIGFTCYPTDFKSKKSSARRLLDEAASEQDVLIYMADKALYRAKKNGRNRVLSYSDAQTLYRSKPTHEQERDSIQTVLAQLYKKDTQTYLHSFRVALISELLAKELKLSSQELHVVKYGGLLHDVGKIAIPDAILFKKAPLTEAEYAEMKTHTLEGLKLTTPYPHLQKFSSVIRSHHERYDGSGYQDGLSGTRIPLEARIVAVADSYDAMTVARHYHKVSPETEEYAVEELRRLAGVSYDPAVVAAFFSCYEAIQKIKQIQHVDVLL